MWTLLVPLEPLNVDTVGTSGVCPDYRGVFNSGVDYIQWSPSMWTLFGNSGESVLIREVSFNVDTPEIHYYHSGSRQRREQNVPSSHMLRLGSVVIPAWA